MVDVGAAFPSDSQPSVLVEQGEGCHYAPDAATVRALEQQLAAIRLS